jgi:hypothetical protein
VHRRDFNLGILKISAAAVLSPHLFASPLAEAIDNEPSAIATLYKNAIIVDSLCAPLLNNTDARPTAEILTAVRQSGITRHQLHYLGRNV